MRYGSVCSGIEAASVAWHSLGWEAQWYSEIEHFPSEVLKYRFPNVPNLGDMTQLNQNPIFNEQPIDLLVGGTPCQSFSVAGLRKGLADPRGNLMLTFLSIADKRRPKWILWENVPGVLSSNGGKDFGTFLGALGELGYGFAYRVLDAQYFGVAQRRRRVFVIGYLGDWRPAAAVLFESESLQRDSKPSRAKRQETPTDAQGSLGATSDVSCAGGNVSPCVTSKWKTGYGGPSGSNETGNMVYEQVAQPFRKVRRAKSETDFETWEKDEKANTLNCFDQGDVRSTNVVAQPIAVDWRTTQVDVEMTGTLKTDLAKMSGPCIAVDTYNYTTNKKTTQTIRSQKSDTEHIGAVMQPIAAHKVSPTLTAKMQGMSGWAPYNETEHLVPVAQPIPILAGEHPQKEVSIDVCPTLPAAMGMGGGHTPLVPHPIADLEQKSVGALCARDFKGVGSQYVDEGKVITSPVTMAIRRLTPKECERLQGFPDDWTKIPYRNKPADQCPDGPRYKACGNSMAVPVMRWIGERIQMIENYLNPNL